MTAQTIRQKYLDYMRARDHQVIKRAPLVLTGDQTTLFTGSGMQPLMPYLLGQQHPQGKRLANSQVCLRVQDIEEVGDNSHTTCFEMLGNWSLGDYFKQEQLTWYFNFLIHELKLDINKLYVSCFRGDEKYDLPKDDQAAVIIQKLFKDNGLEAKIVDLQTSDKASQTGMMGGRIFFYDDTENWWSRGGNISQTMVDDPCGGDCEFFYDFGEEFHDEAKYGLAHPASDSLRFLEIGNSVFMEYQKLTTGFQNLEAKNVDFGGGLERMAAACLNNPDIFQVSLLAPVIGRLEELSSKAYQAADVQPAMRVIADHLRAAVWLSVDGVTPSNKEQGYVLRRLFRRAQLKAFKLDIKDLSRQLIPVICQIYQADYPEFTDKQELIIANLSKEEATFKQTLNSGLREFYKLTRDSVLTGDDLFKLYDTYGFPKELSQEEAGNSQVTLKEDCQARFEQLMNQQRERSKTITVGKYKGGLADHDPQTIKYHTATHLMYRALKNILGDQVIQRGSHISSERLRFDFAYHQKVSPEQIAAIEDMVNRQIDRAWPISHRVEKTEEALKQGVLGAFGDKYGDEVTIYTVGDPDGEHYSREICGGPHVENTAELGEGQVRFKIIKEESSSANVRRIKAILG